jgi:hypothetical protein
MKSRNMNKSNGLRIAIGLGLKAAAALVLALFVTPQPALGGGMHSGGGPGVATYRPGAAKTYENLVRVESLAVFKARSEGKLPALNQAPIDPSERRLKAATAMKKIRTMLNDANPEFYLQFALASEKFSFSLAIMRDKHEVSKTLTADGRPAEAPLALIEDFGAPPPIAGNQQFVQIVRRTGEEFEPDMNLWDRLASVEDELDLMIHEPAYAVSWQRNSLATQKFQIYVLAHYLRGEPLEKEEFQRLAQSEWGFVQARPPLERLELPGVRVASSSERPWNEGELSQAIPGIPMGSKEGLQCGILRDEPATELASTGRFFYWNGSAGVEKQVSFSEKDRTLYRRLKVEAGHAIRASLNPLTESYLTPFLTVFCFEKSALSGLFGFGKLKYMEFRLVRDVKKLRADWASAGSSFTRLDNEIVRLMSEKIRKALEPFRGFPSSGSRNLRDMAEEVRRQEALIYQMNLDEYHSMDLRRELYMRASMIAENIATSILVDSSVVYEAAAEALEYSSERFVLESKMNALMVQRNPPTIKPPPYVLTPSGVMLEKSKIELAGSFAVTID